MALRCFRRVATESSCVDLPKPLRDDAGTRRCVSFDYERTPPARALHCRHKLQCMLAIYRPMRRSPLSARTFNAYTALIKIQLSNRSGGHQWRNWGGAERDSCPGRSRRGAHNSWRKYFMTNEHESEFDSEWVSFMIVYNYDADLGVRHLRP